MIALTLDLDWAPDPMVDAVAARLVRAGVRATWFVTHAGPAVERLREHPELFELGVHPNFRPETTHGADPLAHVLEIVPEARCVRTHSLVSSTPLLERFMGRLEVDASLYLPHQPHLAPFEHHSRAGCIVRVAHLFEDDLEMARPDPCWDPDALLAIPGLRVFDFHPVHIALNAHDLTAYETVKHRLDELDPRTPVPAAPGAGTLFDGLVERLAATGGGARLSDVVARWRSAAPPTR